MKITKEQLINRIKVVRCLGPVRTKRLYKLTYKQVKILAKGFGVI